MYILRLVFAFFILLRGADAAAQHSPYTAPRLESDQSWSIILLPDPQAYVKFERNQGILELMTSWISENIDAMKIRLVLCTGDLVDKNELVVPDGIKENQPSVAQWEAVSRAFSRLDGKVPYLTATGNHDYGIFNSESRRTNFSKYFPVNKNPLNQKALRAVALNAEGMPTLENACYEFSSPKGQKYLALSLEYMPRDTVVGWAKKIVSDARYKDHRVLLLTHYYMGANNDYLKGNHLGNSGKDLWEKLIQPAGNIRMVFAGHIGKANDPRGHIAFREDPNKEGKKVHQMVFNAQGLGGGFDGNGGDGWLRILEFLPDGKTVRVKTFSPLFAISPATQHLAWRTSDYDEFTFSVD